MLTTGFSAIVSLFAFQISLRLLRLFRIFQLVRLGQYNAMFRTLTNVLVKSLNYLRLLILILAFGGALFGSMIYWLEKGTWSYHEASGKYLFVRIAADGVTEEPSPFTSIPASFWWFMVTATTVGYGGKYRFFLRVEKNDVKSWPHFRWSPYRYTKTITLLPQAESGWLALPCCWASLW
jgi:hypothetical protein